MMKIQVVDMIESSRVQVRNLRPEMVLEQQLNCPSCAALLQPICLLISNHYKQRIRVGLCSFCGYMGYIDRPTQEWLAVFYSEEWDKVAYRKIKETKSFLDLTKIKTSRSLAFSLVKKLGNLDKSRPVCEIGCGYGEILKNFQNIGFKNIIGVENSAYRAMTVKKALGLEVLYGSFESEKVQKDLMNKKPISLIFSHHVLEHVYNPADVIEKASALQDFGDYLVLSLPNAYGEHINYILFYLVHLHSFTKESIELLLNKNNYEIIEDNSPDDTNIVIAAKKVDKPKPKYSLARDYYDGTIKRLKKGLALDRIEDSKQLYQVYWQQKADDIDSVVMLKVTIPGVLEVITRYFRKVVLFIKTRFLRIFSSYRHLIIIKSLDVLSIDSMPLEIHFSKNIKFLVK